MKSTQVRPHFFNDELLIWAARPGRPYERNGKSRKNTAWEE